MFNLKCSNLNVMYHGMEMNSKEQKERRLYKKMAKTKVKEDRSKFTTFQKTYTKMVTTARLNYLDKVVGGGLENGNCKPFWKYVKQLKKDSTRVNRYPLSLIVIKDNYSLNQKTRQKSSTSSSLLYSPKTHHQALTTPSVTNSRR